MANNAVLNTIYNQYLTTYAPSSKMATRFDTHKRSELRNIYNSIVKLNKDAPLYKVDSSEESREYIIGLKEESRTLHNNIAAVIGDASSTSLDGKIAYSSNENIVSAKYLANSDDNSSQSGDESADAADASFNIEVQSLATPQVNLGLYLPTDELNIKPGDYSFDVSVNGQGYEFQYSVRNNDTNFELQNRLSRLINNSGIHLTSEVVEDNEGNSALRIESTQAGIRLGQTGKAFTISDKGNTEGSGSVEYLGIDYVAREASNAHFLVNGEEAESSSNTFVLNKMFEITLNDISPNEGEAVSIGIKPDTEAAIENVSNLVGSYNNFIKTMSEYSEKQPHNANLLGEMNGIARVYQQEMEKIGISFDDDGIINVDKDTLSNAIIEGDSQTSLSSLRDFSGAMLRKSNQISLNPVSYINKTVVAYKNPGKNFNSPYTSSAYSGYLFNSYC